MMSKHYEHCPDCHTRMVRTGQKTKETQTLDGGWLYTREYECNGCGKCWLYNEARNLFYRGRIVEGEMTKVG